MELTEIKLFNISFKIPLTSSGYAYGHIYPVIIYVSNYDRIVTM